MNHATPGAGYHLHPQLAADTHALADLDLCELRLLDDANYPWLVLVPRVPGARELTDLPRALRHQLSDEIACASAALQVVFQPHKLNVAALGNQVPQLHVHVIARFLDDPARPAPVWGKAAPRPYAEQARLDCVARLRAALPG
jgi:diadenosine tetraphosphate (Ap4A) HIT family hydrolase